MMNLPVGFNPKQSPTPGDKDEHLWDLMVNHDVIKHWLIKHGAMYPRWQEAYFISALINDALATNLPLHACT